MEERNANHPGGVDRGARRVISHINQESILTSVPAYFRGGNDTGSDPRKVFSRTIDAQISKKDLPDNDDLGQV